MLKERSAGRLGDPEGWVKIENIIQAWREKQTLDWFDVEYMGLRPSASGLVNKPEDVDACVIDDLSSHKYIDGATVVGGLDWGYSGMTAWTAFMEHTDQVKVQLENTNYTQIPLDDIIDGIVEDVIKYKIRFIYADSAGKFENVALQNALNKKLMRESWKCVVIEVVFSKSKYGSAGSEGEMSMFGNYRAHIERHKLRIPRKHVEAIWQHKRYRFAKNSDKALKEDDHIPDSTMCALKHWQLGRVYNSLPASNTDKEQQRSEKISTLTGNLLSERF